MVGHVTIQPSGHEYPVESKETILESGLKAGLALVYGCSNANCGLCKAKLISGDVVKVRRHDYTFTEAEKGQGYFLMCANGPVSDVVVEAPEAFGAGDVPVQNVLTRVTKLETPDDTVVILHLKTPRTQRLRFLAGQHVRLSVGEASAEYSVASCPCDDMRLQFHIPRLPGDAFAEHVHSGLAKTDVVSVRGPEGEFVLREKHDRPIVFVAIDTGFAPIRSLLEQAMALEMTQPLSLYWMVRAEGGHYLHNLCRSWKDALDNFQYRALVANAAPDQEVLARIKDDHGDLSGADAYLCGDTNTVGLLGQGLLGLGLLEGRLFTEPLRHG